MHRAIEGAVRIWAIMGGLILLSIVFVTSTNVAGFLLNRVTSPWGYTVSGLPGYEDFVRLAISVAALTFFPYCQLRRGHVVVELFTNALPPRTQRVLDVVWLGATVFLALFLAAWMWVGMWERYDDNAVSRVLGWPQWPFFLPGIVSLILWAAVALTQIVAPSERDHG